MAISEKDINRYLRGQGFSEDASIQAWQISAEWQDKGIRLWPINEENKKSFLRLSIIVVSAIERKMDIRFLAPVCPDYPLDSQMGELGVGINETIKPFLPAINTLIMPLAQNSIPFKVDMILADTETDLPEVVKVLAGTTEEFLDRCQKSVETIRLVMPGGVMVSTFSEFFSSKWYMMQYYWEKIIKNKIETDRRFDNWLRGLSWRRQEKYERQFARRMTVDECLNMAIRHYAQYSTLGYWMRQYSGAVLINTDSPNLRVIRDPILVNDPPDFLPNVNNQQQRIPVIVP